MGTAALRCAGCGQRVSYHHGIFCPRINTVRYEDCATASMIQPSPLLELVSAARMIEVSTADAATDEEEEATERFLAALALFDDLEV
jgi:hypothetical protein